MEPGHSSAEALLSVEKLEERARALAAAQAGVRRRFVRPAHLRRLEGDIERLREAYRLIAQDVHEGRPIPPAAEWVLDNFHLIEAEARNVQRDLPATYYRQLPRLAGDLRAGARGGPRRRTCSRTATPAWTPIAWRASWPRTSTPRR